MPQNLIFAPLYHTFWRFCTTILPFYTRLLPLHPPKHRLRNRNFSLLLCKITLKMHKNKKFCIRHFTLFEQICYKSCNNIKLYLCFLQIILYIYSHFCKIMPYYSHTFTAPIHRHYARIRIYARTRIYSVCTHIYTRIAHTQLHVYTHAFNIYKVLWHTSNKKYAPNRQYMYKCPLNKQSTCISFYKRTSLQKVKRFRL